MRINTKFSRLKLYLNFRILSFPRKTRDMLVHIFLFKMGHVLNNVSGISSNRKIRISTLMEHIFLTTMVTDYYLHGDIYIWSFLGRKIIDKVKWLEQSAFVRQIKW